MFYGPIKTPDNCLFESCGRPTKGFRHSDRLIGLGRGQLPGKCITILYPDKIMLFRPFDVRIRVYLGIFSGHPKSNFWSVQTSAVSNLGAGPCHMAQAQRGGRETLHELYP